MDNTSMGHHNTGNYDTGNYNVGHQNAGHHNTGHYNAGDFNVGGRNIGDLNAGDFNTGHRNTGRHNTGHRNTGDFNTGDRNTGYFCTETPPPTFFDKPTTLTRGEAHRLIPHIRLPCGAEWVTWAKMTDHEKTQNANAIHDGGYLKEYKLPLTESFPQVWESMDETARSQWTNLPNFDADKFLEITGVDVRTPDTPETHTISIDGGTIEISHKSWLLLRNFFCITND